MNKTQLVKKMRKAPAPSEKVEIESLDLQVGRSVTKARGELYYIRVSPEEVCFSINIFFGVCPTWTRKWTMGKIEDVADEFHDTFIKIAKEEVWKLFDEHEKLSE